MAFAQWSFALRSSDATSLTVRKDFVWIVEVKRLLTCVALLMCTGCNTLENRRDLYSPDTYLYEQRGVTTTVRETATMRNEPPALRAEQEEPGPVPGR